MLRAHRPLVRNVALVVVVCVGLIPGFLALKDILKSSNLERMLHLLENHNGAAIKAYFAALSASNRFQVSDDTIAKVQSLFVSRSCCQEDVVSTIRRNFVEYGIVLDPHTAVATKVGNELARSDTPLVICATAHYVKFPAVVLDSIVSGGKHSYLALSELMQRLRSLVSSGARPAIHKRVEAACFATELQSAPVEASASTIRDSIISFFRQRSKH